MNAKQVVVIHGSDCYETYEEFVRSLAAKKVSAERLRPRKDWKMYLGEALGSEYDILTPQMPLKNYAPYDLWELWFERCSEVFEEQVVLVGHSLGGIFLAKYLAEHADVPFGVASLHLVAAPYEDDPLCPLPTSWRLPGDLSALARYAVKTHIFHSTDDPVVPYTHAKAYPTLLPEATLHTFEDRGHFLQGEFPELVAAINGVRLH